MPEKTQAPSSRTWRPSHDAKALPKPSRTGKQVVVFWAERASVEHPHAGGWSKWIAPVTVQLPCVADIEVTVQDMHCARLRR